MSFRDEKKLNKLITYNIDELVQFISKYPTLPKRWLTPEDLEIYLEMSIEVQNKYREVQHVGRLPYSKYGKSIRYDIYEIDLWLEEHSIYKVCNRK